MLDRLAALTHCLRMFVEPALHRFENILLLPACDPALVAVVLLCLMAQLTMLANGQIDARIAILEPDLSTGVQRNVYLAEAYAIKGRFADAADTLLRITTQIDRRSVEDQSLPRYVLKPNGGLLPSGGWLVVTEDHQGMLPAIALLAEKARAFTGYRARFPSALGGPVENEDGMGECVVPENLNVLVFRRKLQVEGIEKPRPRGRDRRRFSYELRQIWHRENKLFGHEIAPRLRVARIHRCDKVIEQLIDPSQIFRQFRS